MTRATMERSDRPLPAPGRIVTTGTRFTYAHAGALVRASSLYFIVNVALYTAGDYWNDLEFAFSIGSIVVFAYFSWDWHRAYFFGTDTVSWKGSLISSGHKEHRRAVAKARRGFVWRAIGLNLILALVIAAAGLPFIASARSPTGGDFLYIVLVIVPAIVLMTYLTVRILPSFASYARDRPMTWKKAWRLSKVTGWRFVSAIGILLALVLIAFFLFQFIVAIPFVLFDMPALIELVVINVELSIFMFVLVAIGSVCNAFVYSELTGFRCAATTPHTKDLAG